MSNREKIADEVVQAIKADLKNPQLTGKQIAEKNHLHVSTVYRIKSNRWPYSAKEESEKREKRPSPKQHAPSGIHAAKIPEIKKLIAKGITVRAIAHTLKMKESAVNYYKYKKFRPANFKPKTTGGKKHAINGNGNIKANNGETNGHTPISKEFLIGFGCGELDRARIAIAERLSISPEVLGQGYSKFLGH